MEHIVDFQKYCPLCRYERRSEVKDPCDDCLSFPVNEDSRKPVSFKDKNDPDRRDRK